MMRNTALAARVLWIPMTLVASWSSGSVVRLSVFAFHQISLRPQQCVRPTICDISADSSRILFSSLLKTRQQSSLFRLFSSHMDSTTASLKIPVVGSSAVLSQKPFPTDATELQMLSFYHFEEVKNPLEVRDALFRNIQGIPGLRGTIYVAKEGINGQMAVPLEGLGELLSACTAALPFDPFASNAPNLGDVVNVEMPTFDRLIVRVRDNILRDGLPNEVSSSLDWTDAGPELPPSKWHQQVQKEDAVVIDCRNLYESQAGTFQGAIPLGTDTFQETWEKLDEIASKLDRDKPVHIFCTGGIRCVKVGAYMKQHLKFSNVNRLQHGIIGYDQWLHQHPETDSAFSGENFLFDKRRFSEEKDDEKP